MDYYSKKSLWKWVLVYILIGVVVYGFVYYFVFHKKYNKNYQYSENASEQIISNSQNEIADWKTYRNDEYGFEIKYPREGLALQVKEDELGNKTESPNQCTQISYGNSFIYISLPPYNVICGGTTGLGIDSIKLKEEVSIGGEVYQAEGWRTGPNYEFLSFAIKDLHITYGIIEGLNSNDYNTSKDLIYRILSTFKFVK